MIAPWHGTYTGVTVAQNCDRVYIQVGPHHDRKRRQVWQSHDRVHIQGDSVVTEHAYRCDRIMIYLYHTYRCHDRVCTYRCTYICDSVVRECPYTCDSTVTDLCSNVIQVTAYVSGWCIQAKQCCHRFE